MEKKMHFHFSANVNHGTIFRLLFMSFSTLCNTLDCIGEWVTYVVIVMAYATPNSYSAWSRVDLYTYSHHFHSLSLLSFAIGLLDTSSTPTHTHTPCSLVDDAHIIMYRNQNAIYKLHRNCGMSSILMEDKNIFSIVNGGKFRKIFCEYAN